MANRLTPNIVAEEARSAVSKDEAEEVAARLQATSFETRARARSSEPDRKSGE
jgi:hypothetical protein